MKWVIPGVLAGVVFFAAIPAGAAEGVEITPDVVYGHKHGMALTFDVFRPRENANGAGVLFIISGGWYSIWAPPEQSMERFRPLWDRGFTVFAVRHGSSPKYVIPEIIEDVRRAVRYVRFHAERFGVDADRLGVTGGSAGGHLSLLLGTVSDKGDPNAKDEVLRSSDQVAAVVAYFPPTDIRDFVTPDYTGKFPALKFPTEQADDCSPIMHVTGDDPPILLVHGDRDRLVPLEQSERLRAKLKEKKVPHELLVIKGAGHGFTGENSNRASDARVAWFEKYLSE